MKRSIQKLWISDQWDGTHLNPVLNTDYSDHDVIRADEDFYIFSKLGEKSQKG